MNCRALTLAISLLMSGCFSLPPCDGMPETRAVELDVHVDLHAVSRTNKFDYRFVAVGAEGTIVAWEEANARVSTIGTVDLRAAEVTTDTWWVVGDAGTVAVSGDKGQTWSSVTVPTTADLHAIVRFGSQLVMAGDAGVLVQAADGTWFDPGAPNESWGQLRGLFHQAGRLYAVGLGGVIWSTADAHEWVAESSGTEADLFAIGGDNYSIEAVGAAGTVLVRDSGKWERIHNAESVDLVASDHGFYLGADGALYGIEDEKVSQIEMFTGAPRAMVYDGGLMVVGDAGTAFTHSWPECY